MERSKALGSLHAGSLAVIRFIPVASTPFLNPVT